MSTFRASLRAASRKVGGATSLSVPLRTSLPRMAFSAAPHAAHTPSGSSRALRWGAILALGGLGIAYFPRAANPMLTTTESNELETVPRASHSSLSETSTPALIRSYLVYTACSLPFLIDTAPSLLHVFTHSPIPGLRQITEFLVRHTFFAQFVPGETAAECMPEMQVLRRRNIGTMLNYSAEADESGDADPSQARAFEKKRLEEIYSALTQIGDFERGVEAQGGMRGSTGFALKIVSSPPRLLTVYDSTLMTRPA